MVVQDLEQKIGQHFVILFEKQLDLNDSWRPRLLCSALIWLSPSRRSRSRGVRRRLCITLSQFRQNKPFQLYPKRSISQTEYFPKRYWFYIFFEGEKIFVSSLIRQQLSTRFAAFYYLALKIDSCVLLLEEDDAKIKTCLWEKFPTEIKLDSWGNGENTSPRRRASGRAWDSGGWVKK